MVKPAPLTQLPVGVDGHQLRMHGSYVGKTWPGSNLRGKKIANVDLMFDKEKPHNQITWSILTDKNVYISQTHNLRIVSKKFSTHFFRPEV